MIKKLYCTVVPNKNSIDTTQVHRGTAHTCPSNSSVGTTSRRLVRPERARGRTGRCVINRRNLQVCIQYDRDGGHLRSRRCCFSFCRIRWSLLPLSSPFRCLRFHALRSVHSICRRRPLFLIPLLASSLCWLRWCSLGCLSSLISAFSAP